MINTKRPNGYKAKPPVDLVRRTPKPGRRKNFFDPEDVSFAVLAGPHSVKNLILEADKEINEIRREVNQLAKRYIPYPNRHIISTVNCNTSEIGLCVYEKPLQDFSLCIFCQGLYNND